MQERKYLLGYYNYTVVLTYLGMLFGFVGITLIMEMKYQDSVICLMISGLCDMFDGAVASTKVRNKMEKRFGIQIDSLSDLICFGVLPALFVYQINEKSYLSFVAAGTYVLSALIRLSYFNVCEEERQDKEETSRTWYQGLPVTTVALLLPAVCLIASGLHVKRKILTLALLFIMSILFLLPIKIKKPHIAGKIGVALLGCLEFVFLLLGVLGDI